MIAILALAALITAFLIASALNRSSADISNEREQRTMNSLRQAKAALIAYAAAVDWKLQTPVTSAQYLQPGALPCPDTDGDGKGDCVGAGAGATSSMIGRLPWVTMSIDDLRDASGEQIWYALSHDFRKQVCADEPNPPGPANAAGCTRINSDTQGQLTVTGAAAAGNVVAVLIAPGQALQGQTRPSNNASDYIEGYLPGDGVHFTFTTNAKPDDALNDRILVITQAELMAAVEPVVATKIENEVAPLLKAYYDYWGAYPFPAPFTVGPANPGRLQSEYKGAATQTSGLLPITNTTTPGWFSWDTSLIVVTQIPGGTLDGVPGPTSPPSCTWSGSGSSGSGWGSKSGGPGCMINLVDCHNGTSSSQIVCQIDYDGPDPKDNQRPAVQIQLLLQDATLSFPKQPLTNAALNLSMKNSGGNPVSTDSDHAPTDPNYTGPWSWSTPPLFVPTVSFSGASRSDGSAVVTFQGRLQNVEDMGGRVTITIPAPATAFDTVISGSKTLNPTAAWFIANEWFRQTYYAVSKGYLPGGGNTCTNLPAPPLPPPPPQFCLQVNNLRPSFTPPNNNKRAILVFAGRSVNSATRPNGNLADYLEGANLTAANGTAPYIYENRIGLPTSINDRVALVPPSP